MILSTSYNLSLTLKLSKKNKKERMILKHTFSATTVTVSQNLLEREPLCLDKRSVTASLSQQFSMRPEFNYLSL
jgi:hypothetical protein